MIVSTSDTARWAEFLRQNEGVEFVWLQYITYSATAIVQIMPVNRFTQLIQDGQSLPITKAIYHLLPGDILADGALPSGACHLKPDLSTLYRQRGSNSHRAVVMTSSLNGDGTPLAECARSRLVHLTDLLTQESGYFPLVGFEMEVVFLRRVRQDGKVHYESPNTNHSVFSMTNDDKKALDLVEEVVRALLEAGIALEKFHAESAPGQWEFVLPKDTPVKAVDTLLKARAIISDVAERYDVRATMHPRLFPTSAGNGMHTHISINPTDGQDLVGAEHFFAGIIEHFPAVLAFNLAHEASYSRVQSGTWSGGEYAAWGWENKEMPLRRITTNRFEVKLLDGLANPYLALSGMLAAGIDGLRKKLPLTGGDCRTASGLLTAAEREALGIKTPLPKSLTDSLDALEADDAVSELVSSAIVSTYLGVKRGEVRHFKGLSDEETKDYLISKY
ncbi:glutamine synthetase/guanido kinase [Aspergillus steynii IBT 23096]|uniref:Glutamine synthetase/guanido kinase n=1 Tax=Aspergillus steynii IBT 23096 TaxID=1392250 RepID=A0A2I2G7R3_9EURO|nr:glutamine synthetase/guanido kinase [Aspergillus steynii IBT 23096]PLB48927.1 glutamine synthetase/guanido kinase [Aspergillus steynii IBT 23096]